MDRAAIQYVPKNNLHVFIIVDRRVATVKYILGIIAILLAIGFIGFLLPAIVGIAIGIGMIKSDSVVGGIIAIVIGVAINAAMLYGSAAEGGSSGYSDDDCPFCGSGDTDGNHCHTCDGDF